MKASDALSGRLTLDDEVRIQAAVARGLMEGVIRLLVLALLVPVATVLFVALSWMFPAPMSEPMVWGTGLVLCFALPYLAVLSFKGFAKLAGA
jgi:hypothetical protein